MPRGMTHTAEQMIRALRLVDEGMRVGDVCRQTTARHGAAEVRLSTAAPAAASQRHPGDHKRVHRLYRLEGLSVRVKRRRRQAAAPREVPPLPSSPMQRWSMDFVFDATADGSRFRVLTIVDRPGTSSGQTHRSRPQDSVCIGACA
jgi:transposase InsO family protein